MAEKELGKFKLSCGRFHHRHCKAIFYSWLCGILIPAICLVYLLIAAGPWELATFLVGAIVVSIFLVMGMITVMMLALSDWCRKIPEFKLEKVIKEASRIAQNRAITPPEVSAKIYSLVTDAEKTKNADRLTDWLEKYNWLVVEKRKVAGIKNKYRGIFTRLTKIRNVETELGISKEN